MLDISISALFAGFVFSVIGFWLIKMAKQRSNIQLMLIGFALVLYTYFTKGPWLDWGVGIALCAYAYRVW
jgi:hypothetical protein